MSYYGGILLLPKLGLNTVNNGKCKIITNNEYVRNRPLHVSTHRMPQNFRTETVESLQKLVRLSYNPPKIRTTYHWNTGADHCHCI